MTVDIEVKLYDKKPPRIEVIKVTRTNYNEVAAHIGTKSVTVSQNESDIFQTVTLNFKDDSEATPLVFKIPVEFSHPFEAYIYRDYGSENSKWALIRQYDLGFGYLEVNSNKNKDEN